MQKVFSPRAKRGQALYEFAITLPLLLLIMGLILDFGRLYYTYVALEDAVHEGAIYYMLNTECPLPNSANCSNPHNAWYRMTNATGGQEVDWSRVEFSDVIFSGADSQIASVTLTYDYEILLPGINGLFENGTFPLTVTSQVQDFIRN